MTGTSKIEWTEQTWNPIVGCTILSPGCSHCYAMSMAARLEAMGQPRYAGTTRKVNGKPVWTGHVARAPDDTLIAPLKRKVPTTYFVNSMSDLFHESVPDAWIDRVFAVMALCPQHTFQVLTKRAARMQAYMAKARERIIAAVEDGETVSVSTDRSYHSTSTVRGTLTWPLPNVWLGVSTERQREADERIPHLLQTPAAIRFISAEPLIGPIDLETVKVHVSGEPADWFHYVDALTGCVHDDVNGLIDGAYPPGAAPKLDWVIVGGESGRDARPMHPAWARDLRDQCAAAGVPFFFKQWGQWSSVIDRDRDDPDWRKPYSLFQEPLYQMLNLAGGRGFHGNELHVMRRRSKATAGRILDGVTHDELPSTPQIRAGQP